MPKKAPARPRAAARKGSKASSAAKPKPGGSLVSTWEDDPLSVKAVKPVQAPAPALGKTPYPLAIAGAAPAPKTYPAATASFRYWDAAVALRRGADFWGSIVAGGTGWQPGGTLTAPLDHGKDLNAYYD